MALYRWGMVTSRQVRLICRCGAVLDDQGFDRTGNWVRRGRFAGRKLPQEERRPGAPLGSDGSQTRYEFACSKCRERFVTRSDRYFDAVSRARQVGRSRIVLGEDLG